MTTSQTRSVEITLGPKGITIGNGGFVVIAGPCSVESEEQFLQTAQCAASNGAQLLRGGIYKMRTNPDSFQGLGEPALEFVKSVKKQTGLGFVSEVTDPRQIEAMHDWVDVFQVGTRNMYNYSLLSELGKTRKPVLLKRGFSALVEEWLLAAEYVTRGGNSKVILCERGIRTFEKVTRNTLDLSSVAYIKQNSPYPVLVDPSHATGVRALVAPMAKAAVACGADGLLIETHPNPEKALSDGYQALDFNEFGTLMSDVKVLLSCMGREFHA